MMYRRNRSLLAAVIIADCASAAGSISVEVPGFAEAGLPESRYRTQHCLVLTADGTDRPPEHREPPPTKHLVASFGWLRDSTGSQVC